MKNSYPFWFFVFVLIIFHLFGYIGHYGYDDIYYAKLAKSLLQGQIDFSDHYSYRWVPLAYLALCYKIFGVGDFASVISALSISVATLWVTFLLIKQQSRPVIFFTLSILVSGNWYIFYTDKITPDIYVLLFATCGIYFLVQQKFNALKKHSVLNALGLSIAMLLGFLSKETMVMLAPALLFFAISDWVQKQNRVFWISSVLFGSLFLINYFYFINRLTGNAWARFSAMQGNEYYNSCSYDAQAIIFTIRRITYQFIALFAQSGMGIALAFLASALSRKKIAFFKPVTIEDFYIVLSVCLLLTGNFMSTTFKAYSPVCLDIRHFLWMMPPLACVAGLGLKYALSNDENSFSIARWLVVLCIASYFVDSIFVFTLYVPFTLLWIWHARYKNGLHVGYFVMLLFMFQLQPIYHWMAYAQDLKYETQKEEVMHVLKRSGSDTIVTDEVQKRLIEYYNHFDSTLYSKVITFDEVNGDAYLNKVIYSNWYTQTLSGMRTDDLPLWMRLHNKTKHQIFADSLTHVTAFKMTEPYTLKTVFTNSFGYERLQHFWTFDSASIMDDQRLKHKRMEHAGEYSATFVLPFDSLSFSGIGAIIIHAKLKCKMKDAAEVKLVIELTADNQNLTWKGEDANHFMKAYGLWWPVTNEVILEPSVYFKKHAILKIYVWMNSKTDLYLDDWEIEILESN